MKIIFFGTSEFAVPILKSIKEKTDWLVAFVVSEPAKPAGRDRQLTESPVATWAKEAGHEIFTPLSLAGIDVLGKIESAEPDLIVLAAYGRILPGNVLNLPKFKAVNIHPSLLPKLRGPAPIQTALLAGLKETGVSLMMMDEKIDHGPIISQRVCEIGAADDYFSLESKLAALGAEMLTADIPLYLKGQLEPQAQNDKLASYTRIIKKEDGRIDWQKTASEVFNQYRAFIKWPGVLTFFKNKNDQLLRLKLIEIEKCPTSDVGHKPGEVFLDNFKNLLIACSGSDGVVKIKKIQPENSRILSPAEFLNGYGYVVGQRLS